MSSSTSRSGLWPMTPWRLRHDRPATRVKGLPQALLGGDRDLGADQAGHQAGIGGLQRLEHFDIEGKGGLRGVGDDEVEIACLRQNLPSSMRCGGASISLL